MTPPESGRPVTLGISEAALRAGFDVLEAAFRRAGPIYDIPDLMELAGQVYRVMREETAKEYLEVPRWLWVQPKTEDR